MLLIIALYCHDDAISEHINKNKLHIFQEFDVVKKCIVEKGEMAIRDFILRKSCNGNGKLLPGKVLYLITLYGQLKLNVIRKDCHCHDFVDDLLLNGIFPATPDKPRNSF